MNIQILKDKKVLYVEDDKAIVNSFLPIFQKIFKEVFTVVNGEEGYYAFKNNQDIDFIITDIKMPRMNGLDMCAAIKKIKADVPCIVTTAHGEKEYYEKAEQIGIYKYITKPLDVQELIVTLTEYAEKNS